MPSPWDLRGILTGCKRNQATGDLQFNYFSQDEEIALGLESREELVPAYGGEIPDEGVRSYVTEIGQRMTPYVEDEYRELPWSFTMLNSDVVNAFALPGGQVFVSRGLASQLEDEAELAGVIGHEIGHVTAEHVDQRMGRQLILAGIAIGASAAANESESQWAQVAAGVTVTGAGVYSLKYDRGQELEADELGMRYMHRAKYDPSALAGVMETLQAASQGQQPMEIFSTHPHPETRLEKIREAMQSRKRYRDTRGDPSYRAELRRVSTAAAFATGVAPARVGQRAGAAHALAILHGVRAAPVLRMTVSTTGSRGT